MRLKTMHKRAKRKEENRVWKESINRIISKNPSPVGWAARHAIESNARFQLASEVGGKPIDLTSTGG